MRQLPVDHLVPVAEPLLDGGHGQCSETVPGHLSLVAHALYRLEDRVVADRPGVVAHIGNR